MNIVVVDFYKDATHHLMGGPEDIKDALFKEFPWLLEKFGRGGDLTLIAQYLNGTQIASIYEEPNTLSLSKSNTGIGLHNIKTSDKPLDPTKDIGILAEAAAFLTGRKVDSSTLRQYILDDNDPMTAVVTAYGMDPRTGPKDILGVVATLKKSEPDASITFKTIVAATESAKEFALEIESANKSDGIKPISLGGVHSSGTLRAVSSNRELLLKPGAGPQNPALGESESGSSQSKREVAFYDVASAWGLQAFVPEARLLLLDGKEYACLEMLGRGFQDFSDLQKQDPGLPRRLLFLYINDIFKWATLDYVCGNPDRNAGNLMASGDRVMLIDHGSSFSGSAFDPPRDKYSFFPYYIRGMCPSTFNGMPLDEKLRFLPRLSESSEFTFRKWLLDLDPTVLTNILGIFGIQGQPSVQRLLKIQAATQYQRADLAILGAWLV